MATRSYSFGGFVALCLFCQAHIVSLDTVSRQKRSSCGGNLVSESGSIKSPNFPYNYPSYSDCTWTIRVSEHHKIRLTFLSFRTESSSTCSYDYLEVFDGSSTSSNRLERFCGSNLPLPVQSSGNTMTLRFKSDSGTQYEGFRVTYEALSTCGGDLFGEMGDVISPNYPESYDSSETCVWFITVPVNQNVVLRFRSFQLETSHFCDYDYLEVRDGHDVDGPLLGKFCGTNFTQNIRSSENMMTLKFQTDASNNFKGFSANFVTGKQRIPLSTGSQNTPAFLLIGVMMRFITLAVL